MMGIMEVAVGSFPQEQWITVVTSVLSTSPYHHGLWAGQEKAGVAPAPCSNMGVRAGRHTSCGMTLGTKVTQIAVKEGVRVGIITYWCL